MKKKSKIAVLGGGIAAYSAAYHLALKGFKPFVLNRQKPGAATPHAAGMLDPFVRDGGGFWMRWTVPAFYYYPVFIRQLERFSNHAVGFEKKPFLMPFFNLNEKGMFSKDARVWKKIGFHPEFLSRKQIMREEGLLSEDIRGGLKIHQGARVKPRDVLRALQKACRKLGVPGLNEPKVRVLETKRSVRLTVGRRKMEADLMVRAVGAWEDQTVTPIVPVRGQIFFYKTKKLLSNIVIGPNSTYAFQWTDGFWLAGATVERVGFRPKITQRGRSEVQRTLARVIPDLKKMVPFDSWVGLRPFSLDKRPLIDRISRRTWVLNGLYRSGILLGPYVGKSVAEQISKE